MGVLHKNPASARNFFINDNMLAFAVGNLDDENAEVLTRNNKVLDKEKKSGIFCAIVSAVCDSFNPVQPSFDDFNFKYLHKVVSTIVSVFASKISKCFDRSTILVVT